MKGLCMLRFGLPKAVIASFAFLIMRVIEKSLIFITSPIYTRMLSQDEYGQVSVFLSWQSMLGIVAMFCLSYGVFNNGMIDYEQDRDVYSFSMLILSNVITLVCGIILFLTYPYIQPVLGIDIPLLSLMFFIFLTQPAFNFWMSRQRFEYKYKAMSVIVIMSAILSSVSAIALIQYWPGHGVYARLFGGFSIFIIVYCFFYVYIAFKAKWHLNINYWKGALLFNLPLIPHYLSGHILNNSNRIIIASLVGNAAAAKYSLAYTIGLAVTIVWSSINSSLIPYTYEKCRNRDFVSLASTTNAIVLLYSIACGILILFAPEMLMIMAPSSYAECVYIIPPIVGGVFFMSMYFIFANVIYYYKRPKYVMYASVTSAVLNIWLNYILIPQYGYFAAGYTTLACFILQSVLDYYAMRKVTGISIYNMRFLLMLGICVLCVSLLSSFLYYNDFMRYALIAALCIALCIFRKKVMSVILKLRVSR
ncbi:oligosaccharide flippase family protein [Cloacibacillus sp. An23]|uniref:lipopolysaccharide biosynthesis protein n=1 Tax=Cloacibacillus sp. An23 TaxID=1965591 RepID=UPI001302C6D9|nr:oligosaccharide flippase family protein [Cloacibacillus sp. An23]